MLKNKFYLKTNKYLVAFFLCFLLFHLVHMSSLNFGEVLMIDPDEPKDLNPIKNSININVDWKKSFSGDNLLGNFKPAF